VVWGHSKVQDLLESVLQDLPAGATLILEVGDKEQFESRFLRGASPKKPEKVTEHLLDGQQRLTALWRALKKDYEDNTYFFKFVTDPMNDKEVVKVERLKRWRKKDTNELLPAWANDERRVHEKGLILLELLDPEGEDRKILEWCNKATGGDNVEEIKAAQELQLKIVSLKGKIAAYNIPVLSLPPTTQRTVALNVFKKLNTNFVRLSEFDVKVAEVEDEEKISLRDLRDVLKSYVPAIKHYIGIEDDEDKEEDYEKLEQLILSVSALRQDKPPTEANFKRLDVRRMVKEWDSLKEGLKWAADFLEGEHVWDEKRLPTAMVLYVLAALHDVLPRKLDDVANARIVLRKYVWRSFFTRRYEKSAPNRALQDLRGLRAVLKDSAPETQIQLFDEREYPLPTLDNLKRAGWPSRKDILARGILAVTIKKGAKDIPTGAEAINHESLVKREYDHLFPRVLLKRDAGLQQHERDKALNCALILGNKEKSAKEPLPYLKERIEKSSLGDVEIRKILSSHLIPWEEFNVGGYDAIKTPEERNAKIRGDYERFIHQRAVLMSEAVSTLCSGKSWPCD
jgi:hypothetical protein